MPRSATLLAAASWLLVVAAAWLDPTHEPLGDYVSWLSDGPYWGLGAVAIGSFAAACVLTALHLHRTIASRPLRDAVATSLGCAAVLALATVAWPSRGMDEPAWRTTVHVGLAVGGYAGVTGAALLVAWLHRQRLVAGAPVTALAGVVVGSLALLGVLSAVARLTDGPDLRGLGQLLLLTAAVGWLAAAVRLRWTG